MLRMKYLVFQIGKQLQSLCSGYSFQIDDPLWWWSFVLIQFSSCQSSEVSQKQEIASQDWHAWIDKIAAQELQIHFASRFSRSGGQKETAMGALTGPAKD